MTRKNKLPPALTVLSQAPDVVGDENPSSRIIQLDPDQVSIDRRFQDRMDVNVDDLTASIRDNGQHIPILVRPNGTGTYQLVYGYRRLKATKALDLKVKAIVKTLSDKEALAAQLIENSERTDLSAIEKAMIATELTTGKSHPDLKFSHDEVGQLLGLHRTTVTKLVSIVNTLGTDLINEIGPARNTGRPKWDRLRKKVEDSNLDLNAIIEIARAARGTTADSDIIFNSVLRSVEETSANNPTHSSSVEQITDSMTATINFHPESKKLIITLKDDALSDLKKINDGATDIAVSIRQLINQSTKKKEDRE